MNHQTTSIASKVRYNHFLPPDGPGAEEVRWPDFGGEIPSIAMFLRVPSCGEPCKTERSTVPLQPSDFRKPTAGSTEGFHGRFVWNSIV